MSRLLAVVLGLAVVLSGCALKTPPNGDPGQPPGPPDQECSSLKTAAEAACEQPTSQVCQASAILYSVAGCGTFEIPKPPAPPVDPCAGKAPICDAQSDVDCWAQTPTGCQYFPAPVVEPTPNPTTPPPPAVGCTLKGEPTVSLPEHRSTLGSIVSAVMLELHPECGYAGGTCLLGDETQQQWQARVEAKLRERGICAGQHKPGTDEIAVARVATDPWEGYRIISGDDTEGPVPPGGARRTVQWPPEDGSLERADGKGSYRAAWLPPAPAPTPPPIVDYGCPAPRPDRVWTAATLPAGWGGDQIGKPRWKINSKPHGNWIDTTAVVWRNEPYCRAIGMSPMADGSGRGECPVRPEGGDFAERIACERYLAEGDWVIVSSGGAACEAKPDNSAQFHRTSAIGSCRLCNPAQTVCSAVY